MIDSAVIFFRRLSNISVLLLSSFATTAMAVPAVNLGTAVGFAVLAETAITTTGTTSIVGDIGISPASASHMTGFSFAAPPTTYTTSPLVVGEVYAADYDPPTPINMGTAIGDLGIAYTDAAGRAPGTGLTELYTGDISGKTLTAGVYKWSTGVLISTDVTLSGSATDVWIFEMAGDLNVADKGSVATGVKVVLAGGAQAGNVFWQVGGPIGATLGTYATFNGTILSDKQIILRTGARLNGRALAKTQVTMDANAVSLPYTVAIAPPGDLDARLNASKTRVGVGQGFQLVLTVTNTGTTAVTNVKAQVWSSPFISIIGPSPAVLTSLPGGGSHATFTWTVMPTAVQVVVFTASATADGAISSQMSSAIVNVQSTPVIAAIQAVPAVSSSYIFPSPARDSARIVYTMAKTGTVDIRVYNASGQLAATLKETKPVGVQSTAVTTKLMAPGVYYYMLERTYVGSSEKIVGPCKFAVKR